MRAFSRNPRPALAGLFTALFILGAARAGSTQSLPPSCGFTDSPLSVGITTIKAVHVTQLRACVNDLRAQRSLLTVTWTDPSITAQQTVVKAVHILELRTALAPVYQAAGASPPQYTTTPAAGTLIRAIEIDQLRSAALAAPRGPTISSLSPTSGVAGTVVTVTGTNFGATQGTSTVKFNGTTGAPTAWSATSLTVPVPSGATTGNVVVTVGGLASNGVAFTVTSGSTPTISSLAPVSGPVGTVVTVTGTGFGATQLTSSVWFGGVVGSPTTWSATSIRVPVPSGATTGNVVVVVSGVGSNGVLFTVSSGEAAPTISSLSPTSGPVGTTITVTGTGFGGTQGTSSVKFNGTTSAPTAWSSTSITVPVPSGATSGNVVVTVGGVASNGVTFTVTSGSGQPTIAAANPISGPENTVITITGANFGATPGTCVCFSVPGYVTGSLPILTWTDTVITAGMSVGTILGPGTLTVSRGTATSNGVVFVVEGPLPAGDPGGAPEYYHADAIGSVRMITDASTAEVKRFDYLPFGQEWGGTSASPGGVRFAGKERDRETEAAGWTALDYFGARYYQSQTGRFTAVDPVFTWEENLLDPQRWNRYTYTRNNPFRYVDPDGRAIETLWDLFNVGTGLMSLGSNLAAGNVGGAALDVAGLGLDIGATLVPGLPGGAGAAIRARRIAENAQMGRAFEGAVLGALGANKNSGGFSQLARRVTTIPDLPIGKLFGVTEIKNVQNVGFTKQLQAQFAAAQTGGLPFNLIVSSRTQHIAKGVRVAVAQTTGKIFVYDDKAKKFTEAAFDVYGNLTR